MNNGHQEDNTKPSKFKNLLSDEYVKQISCDKPQRDEFEIKNLLESDDSSLRNSSFMRTTRAYCAETFVRAPVNIEIVFKKPIYLNSICLDAKVNRQTSNGFIIYSCTPASSNEHSFQQIAKCLNQNADAASNSHFYEFARRNCEERKETKSNMSYFSCRSLSLLNRSTSIKISITRTIGASNPCLKSLKIFGCLADTEQSNKQDELNAGAKDASCKESNSNIPSEFVDQLTLEMMRIPIRLPSQKLIDKSTLDLYLNERRNKNQPEVDPFTQIQFSSSYKPFVDSELKTKIDHFLLENQKISHDNFDSAKRGSLKKRFESTYEEENSSFKKKKLEKKIEQNELKCACCKNSKSTELILYELSSCKHKFCRDCLKAMKADKRCAVCNILFDSTRDAHRLY